MADTYGQTYGRAGFVPRKMSAPFRTLIDARQTKTKTNQNGKIPIGLKWEMSWGKGERPWELPRINARAKQTNK